MQKSVILYEKQNTREKRRILNLLCSNPTWKGGHLHPNYRQIFDMLSEKNISHQKEKAVFNEKNGLRTLWLASLDNCKNLQDSFQYKSKLLKTEDSLKVKKKSPPRPHALYIAKQLQNQLETGSVNKADLARQNGMSRARVTQIMNLLNLESGIKEEILNMSQSEQEYFTERKLRRIIRLLSPEKQIWAFDELKSKRKTMKQARSCGS